MVKLKGPMLSAAASGSIADVLNFSSNHKRQTVRTKSNPRKTRTPKQNAIRLMIAFLGPEWAKLSQADKLTWHMLADQRRVAPYHAYLGTNMQRWANGLFPSHAWPATEAGAVPYNARPNLYTGWHHFSVKSLLGPGPNIWGFIFHAKRTNADYTPTQETVSTILAHFFPPRQLWKLLDLEPGIWSCYMQTFSPTGLPAPMTTRRAVLVT